MPRSCPGVIVTSPVTVLSFTGRMSPANARPLSAVVRSGPPPDSVVGIWRSELVCAEAEPTTEAQSARTIKGHCAVLHGTSPPLLIIPTPRRRTVRRPSTSRRSCDFVSCVSFCCSLRDHRILSFGPLLAVCNSRCDRARAVPRAWAATSEAAGCVMTAENLVSAHWRMRTATRELETLDRGSRRCARCACVSAMCAAATRSPARATIIESGNSVRSYPRHLAKPALASSDAAPQHRRRVTRHTVPTLHAHATYSS